MYVTFDKKANAVESAPSEWNAWNSYKYEGLNTVVEGTTATIKISPNEDQKSSMTSLVSVYMLLTWTEPWLIRTVVRSM